MFSVFWFSYFFLVRFYISCRFCLSLSLSLSYHSPWYKFLFLIFTLTETHLQGEDLLSLRSWLPVLFLYFGMVTFVCNFILLYYFRDRNLLYTHIRPETYQVDQTDFKCTTILLSFPFGGCCYSQVPSYLATYIVY